MNDKAKSIVAGAATGIINGFFGGGGGMLLVPALTRWLKMEDKPAFATCVCIILPLCAASSVVYFMRSSLDIALSLPYLAGGLVGGVIAGKTMDRIPVKALRKILAALIIYGGVKWTFWA